MIRQLVLRGTHIIIPSKLQPRALALAHEGHLGVVSTKQNLRTSEPRCGGQGWIMPPRDIAERIMGVSWWHSQIPVNLCDPPHYQMDLARLRLMGPLPSGHSLLIIVDYYCRFYKVEVMQSTTTVKIIDHMAETFCRHVLPNTMKSDNCPQFKSNEFREYCQQHSILHQKVTAKWAQANGEVERQNQSLLKQLQITQAENKPWRAELRKYLTPYRSIPHFLIIRREGVPLSYCLTGKSKGRSLV